MDDLSKFESDLWEAADNLRANSKLTSSDYFMPVLGIIFLRHAANRFDAATRQITDINGEDRFVQEHLSITHSIFAGLMSGEIAV